MKKSSAKKNLKLKKPEKKLRPGAIVIVLLIILAYLTFKNYGFYKMGKLKWKQRQLEKQLRQETITKDSLGTLRDKALHDSAYIEKVAREKLGMIKKGETVYKFIDTTDSD